MSYGSDKTAGEKNFEYFHDFDNLRPRHFCRQKIFGFFQGIDELRLRQFCRRRNLWIFPGY